jgi:hypothetical protein
MFKLIFILIIIFWLFKINKSKFTFMKKESVYETARDLGIEYLKMIKNKKQPQAVMFDIDDTLLKVNGNDTFTDITPIIELLNFALYNNFLVIIITAREEIHKSFTIKQLNDRGIKYTRLHMRNKNDDFITFKSNIKEKYFNEFGIPFVMSIGDNNIDVSGNYSGYYIKLPDYKDPRLYHLNLNNGQRENVVP